MGRFLSLLISGAVAGTIPMDKLQDTGFLNNYYITENYFRRVEEQPKLVYASGRILGKSVEGDKKTNKTDCSGMLVGYLASMNILKNRNYNNEGEIISDGGLNSYRIYALGDPINRSEAKRGDTIYMEFPSGQKHIAVACDDRAQNIFDFYTDGKAFCRPMPKANVIRISRGSMSSLAAEQGMEFEEVNNAITYFNEAKNSAIDNEKPNKSSLLMVIDRVRTNIFTM